jgi:GDP-L-fucose synthase
VRFITAISADAYGPDDDFGLENSHVVGALIRRIHDARESAAPKVEIWGTGTPRREFIYADDLAAACLFALDRYEGEAPLNLGTGVTTTIAELAQAIRDVVGYRGDLVFDKTRPDGIPLKGLDSAELQSLGWKPQWSLRSGLERTYQGFLQSQSAARS